MGMYINEANITRIASLSVFKRNKRMDGQIIINPAKSVKYKATFPAKPKKKGNKLTINKKSE